MIFFTNQIYNTDKDYNLKAALQWIKDWEEEEKEEKTKRKVEYCIIGLPGEKKNIYSFA